MTERLEDDEPCLASHRWPMAPIHLLPRERWLWWEQLWDDVIMLGERCHNRLPDSGRGRRAPILKPNKGCRGGGVCAVGLYGVWRVAAFRIREQGECDLVRRDCKHLVRRLGRQT
jgi:hypothetical protein